MITEANTAATLEVSIVIHESDLSLLGGTLTSLRASIENARSAGWLSEARVLLSDNGSSATYRADLQAYLQMLGLCTWGAASEQAASGSHWTLEMPNPNCGFGLGHNRGLLRSAQQVFLILNPDVELDPDALSDALRLLHRRPDVVALNPHCTGATGEREYLCKRYPSVAGLFLRGFGGTALRRLFATSLNRYEYRTGDHEESARRRAGKDRNHRHEDGEDGEDDGSQTRDEAQPVELLSGACLLCRAEAFGAVGGFDARYFMYFEDFDLSLRLAALGKLVYLPSMHIRHYGGYSARKGLRHQRWFVSSGFRFFKRHGWKLL